MKTAGILLLTMVVVATGCGRVKDKASRATNKAGELVGEGASTFFSGVGAGIDKTVTTDKEIPMTMAKYIQMDLKKE